MTTAPITSPAPATTPATSPTPSIAPAPVAAPTWNNASAFANAIRSKYPNGVAQDGTPYAKMPDDVLTQKVVTKYPQYASQIKGYSNVKTNAASANTPKENLGQMDADQVEQGTNNITSSVENGADKIQQGTAKGGLGGLGEAATGVGEAGLGTASGAVQSIFAPISASVQKLSQAASDNPEVQKFAQSGPVSAILDAANKGTGALSDWAKAHPEAAKNLGDALNVGGAVVGGGEGDALLGAKLEDAPGTLKQGVSDAAQAAKGGAKAVVNGVNNAADKVLPATGGGMGDEGKLNQHITDTYTKAIKPTIAGKTKNVGQMAQYNKNVVTGIKSIVGNKDALDLHDEFGDPTGHPLPRTIAQFGQAISQAKSAIFNKYDALAKAAGAKGADVQLSPVADELDKIANDKVTNDLHPDLANYASQRAATMRARGAYSMGDAGKAVQNLNKSLESFYRNPSYETASKASVDSLIANKLRTSLDDAVSATTDTGGKDPGYQDLKNQYGALRSIENDVVKRGVVEARQTGGRGLSFGDVTSAEEVIRGLAHMNPQALATGAAIKGVMALKRYMTDPNRAVANLFDTVDKSTGK